MVGDRAGERAGRRVVLHIGTMKSGTTYLQSVLGSNADAFARAGVDVVAGRFAERRARPHHAARELHGTAPGRTEWRRLVEAVDRSSADTVVVSSEFFSFLGPAAIEEAVGDLARHELTVLLAVRDQVGAIPAQWQTYTRNRGGAPFSSYVRQVADPELQHRYAASSFRQAQDVAAMVERWDRPGVDRFVVTTVPPSRSAPEAIWRRFADAAGLPEMEPSFDRVAENESLGYAACDVLRRLNRHLSEMPLDDYRAMVRPLARDVLAPMRSDQGRPRLDRAGVAFALERNRAVRELLTERSTALVGDLEDLTVERDLDGHPEEVAPPDRDQVRACARAVLDHAAKRAGEPVPLVAGIPQTITAAADLLAAGRAG